MIAIKSIFLEPKHGIAYTYYIRINLFTGMDIIILLTFFKHFQRKRRKFETHNQHILNV